MGPPTSYLAFHWLRQKEEEREEQRRRAEEKKEQKGNTKRNKTDRKTRPTVGMRVRNPPTTCTHHNRNEDSETATPHAQHNGPDDDGEKVA